MNLMGNLVRATIESNRDIEVILEHVMRCIHVKLDLIELCNLAVKVAGKVEGSQLKRILAVLLAVDNHF